jgi:hypothetical protein
MKVLVFFILIAFSAHTLADLTPREQRLKTLVPELISLDDNQAYFASIYWVVTQGLRKKIGNREFQSNRCMALLLDEFLVMYFEALDRPQKAPLAWKEAFKAETKPSLHLLLGLNAHISHDLPLSMLRVSKAHPDCSPMNLRYDYFSLNSFFTDIIPDLNKELKRTHQRIKSLMKIDFQKIPNETISRYVVYMRADAWNDFNELFYANSATDQNKYAHKIKTKALKRARLYQKLKLIAPETGF